MEKKEQNQAASMIQGQWRRKQKAVHREQDEAAAKIQGKWRKKQEERAKKEAEEQDQAATAIQKQWKAKQAKKEQKEQDEAARMIQGQWKRRNADPKMKARAEKAHQEKLAIKKEQNEAASMIQGQWKRKKAKRKVDVEEVESEPVSEEDEFFMVFKGGYHFSGEPEKIFEAFFGTCNPFDILNDKSQENLKEMLGHSISKVSKNMASKKLADLVVEVPCTLKELYNGCAKKVCYTRTVLNKDGRTAR